MGANCITAWRSARRRYERSPLTERRDCSHKCIFTTITQAVGSSFQASFQAPLSDFDIRTLLPEVRQARGINLSKLSEGRTHASETSLR